MGVMSRIQLSHLDHDAYDEDAPFLDIDDRADEPISSERADAPPARWAGTTRWTPRNPSNIVLILAVAKFAIVLSGMMLMMPMYRLIEDAICHAHYEDNSEELIEESKCKVDQVQAKLATLGGWTALLNAVTNLIVAYPYGMLADRIGRRPVILLSFSGLAVSFLLAPFMLKSSMMQSVRQNPYILLLGSVFTLVGGGIPVLLATLYAVASDVSSEETKATNFLYLTLGSTMGGLIGPLLGGLLMNAWGPWLPVTIVVCLVPMVCCTILMIPETLSVDAKVSSAQDQPNAVAFKERIAHGLKDMRRSLGMLRDFNIPLILVLFFFGSARAAAASSTIPQYISKHYRWTIADVSILLSPIGIISIALLASLPKLSDILISPRFGLTTFQKDLFLTRTMLVIQCVAALIQGFSPNIGLFITGLVIGTFGGADNPLARATISHYVEPAYSSRLYALLGMVETLGSFVGGPVLALCFNKGLELKGVWTGLPFFYVATLCGITVLSLSFVRPPRMRWGEGETEEEGQEPPTNPIRLD